MFRVTFCAHDRARFVGGPNAWLRRLLPALRDRGIQPKVLFITTSPVAECPSVLALRAQGFDCEAVEWMGPTELHVRWVLERVAEDPPDVLVANLMVPAFYAGRWLRTCGIPTVGVLHSDDAHHEGVQEQFVFGPPAYRLSAMVCVSEFLAEAVRRRDPPATLVRRIPCGPVLTPRTVAPLEAQMRLLYLGRLVTEQKRIMEVARALCRAAREVRGIEALIQGEGPERAAVQQLLSREASSLPVRLGRLLSDAELQELMLGFQVMVLLSDYEGLPGCLMEGMAFGQVPVCLRIRSGIPELVEDGVTGLLVEDREESFVRAIRRLREEPGLWSRLSQGARAKMEKEYSNEVCAAAWETLLRELRSQAGQRQPVKLPGRIHLPPVHPGLAREDVRQPPGYARFYRRVRMFAGRGKRKLLPRPANQTR